MVNTFYNLRPSFWFWVASKTYTTIINFQGVEFVRGFDEVFPVIPIIAGFFCIQVLEFLQNRSFGSTSFYFISANSSSNSTPRSEKPPSVKRRKKNLVFFSIKHHFFVATTTDGKSWMLSGNTWKITMLPLALVCLEALKLVIRICSSDNVDQTKNCVHWTSPIMQHVCLILKTYNQQITNSILTLQTWIGLKSW